MGFGGADVSPTVEFHELTDTEAKVKGFEIPDLYLKSKMDGLVTDIDRQIVDEIDNILELDNDVEIAQSQMKIVKLYYDQESNKLKEVPVHSFKTSLSGMINLNPAMDEIDDDYLWQIFPRGKLFGSLPSDTHEEIKMKEEEIQKAKENNEEFIEWKESLTDSKSLYVKAGSRRKVDRKSARNFKKLDKEDKIPKANFVVIKHGWDKK
ncbi:hypothetical protein DFJ63DRAFT_320837 [Scheffersomyces coipomensis]|uniref:uncharacterized protein n=1 Tax=Scheffersomyces coipomensis TaxID=1788519 RepID=UPI00315D155B